MNQSQIYLRDITPETLLRTEFAAVGPVSSTKTTFIKNKYLPAPHIFMFSYIEKV